MTIYKFNDIVTKAKAIKHSVETVYDFTVTPRWSYYICKAILEPGKNFKGVTIQEASKPDGTHISRQVKKADYLKMCKNLITYVEKNRQLPNWVSYGKYRVNIRLWTYIVSYLLVHYVNDKKLKNQVNVNTKYFVKPTEPTNEVYDYFVKVFGKITCIDDALEKIAGRGYGYYYDDVYSNKQSIDRIKNRQGINCTDATQMMKNVGDGTGKYKAIDCIHVRCQGGDGHVFLRITTKSNEVFYRDPAACLDDGGVTSIWCSNGTVLAINPSWWLANLYK